MDIAIAVILSYLLIATWLSRYLLRVPNRINPLTVFNLAHAGLLACYLIGLHRDVFSFALNGTHVVLLAGGYLAFNLAAIACARPRHSPAPPMDWPLQLQTSLTLVKITLLALIVSVGYKYWLLWGTYGNILASIVAIRLDYTAGRLNYGWANTVAFTASHFLALLMGILEGAGHRYPRRRGLVALAILSVIANDITVGGANWTFSTLCLFLCSWAVTRERLGLLKISWRSSRKALMGIGVAMVGIFGMLALRSEGAIGTDVSFFDTVLYYAGGDIATFGYFVDTPYASIPPGRFVFGGLYEFANDFTSLVGFPFLAPLDDRDFVADIGQNSNTSIHLANYYADFGATGVVLLSALLGSVSMWALNRSRGPVTPVRLQYCALMLWMCVMSIRGVPTQGKYFWALLLAIPLSYRAVRYMRQRLYVPAH